MLRVLAALDELATRLAGAVLTITFRQVTGGCARAGTRSP